MRLTRSCSSSGWAKAQTSSNLMTYGVSSREVGASLGLSKMTRPKNCRCLIAVKPYDALGEPWSEHADPVRASWVNHRLSQLAEGPPH